MLARLTNTAAKAILVPLEYGRDFGLDRDTHQYFEPSTADVPYAGFAANVVALNQMDCLDFLRQGLYHNHEYYRDANSMAWKGKTETALTRRLAHCVDMLRQLVMCEADSSVTGFLKSGVPDSAVTKSCRNFTAVRDFALQQQWQGADNIRNVDDQHKGIRTFASPQWSEEKLWRGY